MLGQVAKQLKREILANKGKASLLALMSVVAMYFWLPLMSSWFSTRSDVATPSTPTADLVVKPSAPSTNTAIVKSEAPTYHWKKLVEWMANDSSMRSAEIPVHVENPFQWSDLANVMAVDEDDGSEDEDETVNVVEVTPQNLGMVLTSTLVGPQVSIVKISGKTYIFDRGSQTEGHDSYPKISFPTDRGEYQFDVLDIQPGTVVLGRDQSEYPLKIRPSTLSGDQSIRFVTGPQ